MIKMSLIEKSILVLAFLTLFNTASALKCHQCNSYNESKCADPFVFEPDRVGEPRKPKTLEFLKECPTPPKGKKYTICRKIYQNVRGDERIIRTCGYEEYKNPCYKTVLEEYNTYVCQCKEDGCNSGHLMKYSVFGLVTMAVMTLVLQ